MDTGRSATYLHITTVLTPPVLSFSRRALVRGRPFREPAMFVCAKNAMLEGRRRPTSSEKRAAIAAKATSSLP